MGFILSVLATVSSLSYGILEIDLAARGEIQDFSYTDGVIYISLKETTEQHSGVVAVNADNGEELWFYSVPEMETPEKVFSRQIEVYGENVYVHLVHLGVLCLNADTGNHNFIWECPSWFHWPPVHAEDRLYISSHGKVSMLNTLTGDQLWEYSVDSEPIDIPCPISDIHFSGERIYVGSICPYLRSLNARTGEPVWMTDEPWRSRTSSYLTIEDVIKDLVIVSANDAELAALNVRSGEQILFLDHCHYLDGDSIGVYLHHEENDKAYLYLLDPATGRLVDSIETDCDFCWSSPVLTSELLCLPCDGGKLQIFSRGPDGLQSFIYQRRVSDSTIMLAVNNHRLFAVSEDGVVFSISLQLDDEREESTGLNFDEPLLVDDSRLIVVSEDRKCIYVFEYSQDTAPFNI